MFFCETKDEYPLEWPLKIIHVIHTNTNQSENCSYDKLTPKEDV